MHARFLLTFFAFVATFWDYQFGLNDHQEHLPLLFRTQDPNYLPGDFFLDANEKGFDPRYYFSWLIIAFTRLFSLPFTYLLLTFLCNLGIGAASFAAGNQLFGGSQRAALWAAALVLSVPTVHIGSVCDVSAAYLTPNALATMLVMWAVVMVWRERWLGAGLLLGLASLLHPLVGPECGAVLFGIGFLQLFATHRFGFTAYRQYALGALVWLLIVGLQLLPYFFSNADSGELAAQDFIRIYAHFRNPHHILPSQFMDSEEWKKSIYFLLLVLMAMAGWRHLLAPAKKLQIQLLSMLGAFVFLAFLGWFFVEKYPMQLFVTAQTFRLLFVVKWLGLVLLGGYAAHLSEQAGQRQRAYGYVFLLASFAWANALRLFLLHFISDFIHRRRPFSMPIKWLETASLLAFAAYSLYTTYLSLEWGADAYLWLLFLVLVLIPYSFRLPFVAIAAVCLSLACAQLFYWMQYRRSDDMSPLQRALARQYSLDDFSGDLVDAAAAIKALTPPNALLVTPPMHSELRYLANRPLVVDFKTYPFKGKAMQEWQDRLFDVYGWTDKTGFDAVRYTFVVNYEYTQDEKFLYLKNRYNCHYALLWKKIPTKYPVLYENATYRLVQL